jgi:phosphoribosylformimino-5-aminoimidazole carboxamide ribotide isomerase
MMDKATIYSDDPVRQAESFVRDGARFLHVVDLDGAFSGRPENDNMIRAIVNSVPLKVQVGGGIRNKQRIEELLSLGVNRVILGTAAARNPEFAAEAVREFGPDKVIVGLDAKNGKVAVQGWAESTGLVAEEFAVKLHEMGIATVVYTDISKDGMLAGPNLVSSVKLAEVSSLQVIVSGGVSSLDDIKAIKAEVDKGAGIDGVIVGKAIYDGALALKDALAVAREEKNAG